MLVSAYARTLALERCNVKTFLIWGNLPVSVFKMEVLLSQPDDMQQSSTIQNTDLKTQWVKTPYLFLTEFMRMFSKQHVGGNHTNWLLSNRIYKI